jgi:hypothetical protein
MNVRNSCFWCYEANAVIQQRRVSRGPSRTPPTILLVRISSCLRPPVVCFRSWI